MRKRSRISDEKLAEWARQRAEFEALMVKRAARFARHDAAVEAWEARKRARRERLRRLTCGLLGRA